MIGRKTQKTEIKMSKNRKGLSPIRVIALGFLITILIGSFILMLPFCVRDGVELKYIDSLYTSTSAVCITGLSTVDVADTHTFFGQLVIALLVQIGGLGVSSMGAAIILLLGKKMDLKERNLIKASMNLDTGRGIAVFVKNVFVTTVIIELAGALLSFFVFIKDFPFLKAVWVSIFHSVVSFNNAGFDLFGSFRGYMPYVDNVPLSLITSALIFLGGIGFLVIREVLEKRFRWKKLSMHSRVVISMSVALTVIGTVLLLLTEDITLNGAFFLSVSTRTAGFANYRVQDFSNAGAMVVIILMFIGASPGSTGGGIKTSTLFILLQNIKAAATGKSEKAFHYSIPRDSFKKASVVFLLGLTVVLSSTYVISIIEPSFSFRDLLFEMTSAYATTGLGIDVSQFLSVGGKLITIIVMYIGRLGPLSIASLWYFTQREGYRYPEGNITIG